MKHIKNFRNFTTNEGNDFARRINSELLQEGILSSLGSFFYDKFKRLFGVNSKKIIDALTKELSDQNSEFWQDENLKEASEMINNSTTEEKKGLDKLVTWFNKKENVEQNLEQSKVENIVGDLDGSLSESNSELPQKETLRKTENKVQTWFRTILGSIIVVGGALLVFVTAVVATIIPFVCLFLVTKGLLAIYAASVFGYISAGFGLFLTICIGVITVISLLTLGKKMGI